MLPAFMQGHAETRLDMDPDCKPDIVSDMVNLPDGLGPFDAVFSCHSLEHLYPYDVVPCLEGFRNVLRSGGITIIYVPDLEDVKPTNEPIYAAECGVITGLDIIYGFGPYLKEFPYMAHHCGFVKETLREVMEQAGYVNIQVFRMHDEYQYNLFATGEAP